MMGKTHRMGGVASALGTYLLLSSKNLLVPNVDMIYQLLVIYQFSYWGAQFADQDQNDESTPLKDPLSRLVYKALHISEFAYRPLQNKIDDESTLPAKRRAIKKGLPYRISSFFYAKHRSWQTHSELVIVTFIGYLYWLFNYNTSSSIENFYFAYLIMTGFIVGYLSHLFLDMLNGEGVHFITGKILNYITRKIFNIAVLPEKLHLVPKTKFFRTGASWEKIVYFLVRVISWVLLAIIIISFFMALSGYTFVISY